VKRQVMSPRRWKLHGYRLTTAEITYHLPDYPQLLQEFIWQDLDLPPAFPELKRFLDFWHRNLEGRVHSVMVAAAPVTQPSQFRFARGLLTLH
jgi:uncharacterized protein Usg